MATAPCTVGFAPHSGWAVAVMLAGTRAEPRLLARERVTLADEALPGSRQPYHALEGLPLARARAALARFEEAAAALARGALETLRTRAAAEGARLAHAAILDASGRSGATLEAILASHALIHTADGQHFRAALAAACGSLGVAVQRVPHKELRDRATARCGSAHEVRAMAMLMARGFGPPWGADQKSAALLAWLLLGA